MTNVVSRGVLELDTAGSIVDAGTLVTVRGVQWVGATTAGHVCELRDHEGTLIYKGIANAANYKEADTPTERAWNGLRLVTIDSGTLYVET